MQHESLCRRSGRLLILLGEAGKIWSGATTGAQKKLQSYPLCIHKNHTHTPLEHITKSCTHPRFHILYTQLEHLFYDIY